MPNGFFMAGAQPLPYRPEMAGAPIGGLMGGVQQGLQMAQTMQEMRAAEQERQLQQQELAQQAGKTALQMQQLAGLEQKQQLAAQEAEREAAGALGSLLISGDKSMIRSTYNRAVARIRKEGDPETTVGLPSRAEAEDMSDKDLFDRVQMVGRQLEDFGMGPEAAVKRRYEQETLGLKQKELEVKMERGEMTSLQKNLKAAGLKPGTPEYKKAILDGSKMGTTVNLGPQTESQRRDDFLAGVVDNSIVEMKDALATFDPTTMKAAIVGKLPMSNFFKTEAHQQFNAAARPVIEAYLVKITGAAYSEIQQSGAIETYMPQPGDKPGTVNSKINRIKEFAKMLKKSAGYAVDDPVPPGAADPTNLTPEEQAQVGIAPAAAAPTPSPEEGQVVDWGSL